VVCKLPYLYAISRLPLRYTSDKNRDTSAPIVGTSGSTPLHFACANGHVNVVIILLQHGAHPDRADKHGVTPEALARESGHDNCAETVRRWIEQKDQDLKNRAEYPYDSPSSSTTDSSSRKHLHVKRSIDNALSLFRTHSSTPSFSLLSRSLCEHVPFKLPRQRLRPRPRS